MKKNSFIEGTIIATSIIIIIKILGMLYVIPFYQIVGSDGTALYSYAYNIYLIFLSISSAGLPDAIAKIISEYNTLGYNDAKIRAYKIGRNLIAMISILSFLILFVFAEEIGKFIIGNLNGTNTYKDVAFVIRCISPSVLLIPFLSITKGYLQGHKYISASSISQLIEQVIRILIILIGSYIVRKTMDGSLSLAVGISLTGAFFGGLFAYIYLKRIIKKQKLLEVDKTNENISDKEILKKIVIYALPFIVISIVTTIYNETDQILVLRTLEYLHVEAHEVEYIASSIATLSPKICMVINAMVMGLTMSLVPAIVSSFAKKDHQDVENKINKAISMIIYISLPLSIGVSVLSHSIWTLFYDTNPIGGTILSVAAFSALGANLYMTITAICQSVNKYSSVYKVSGLGFLLNALLDVPIMLLYNKIGLPTYLGSLTASIIGYTVSSIIGLVLLKKGSKYSYKESFELCSKTLIPAISMLIVLLLINKLIPFNDYRRSSAIIKVLINFIVGALTYIILSIKLGLLDKILGRKLVANIVKKCTFGLLKLKED